MITRALVTGGAGYIGSHACKALHRAGVESAVYDNLSTGNAWAVRWGECVRGDLADEEKLRAALRDAAANTVVHFAASAYVGESMCEPGKYFRNNVVNTLKLLEAMVAVGVRRIVFSSSCATYGIPTDFPIGEDTPQRPVNPYGESKLMCERLVRWFGEAHGLEWVILRYFNAAGADPDGELGECHDPEPHLIPIILRAVAGGTPIPVFGTDYPTPDGTAVRDYVHVADLARAHVLALEHLQGGGDSVALNLASGSGTSVREVVQAAERETGCRARTEPQSRRAGDPPVLTASCDRALDVLGWVPEYSAIDTIIRHAWQWQQQDGRPLDLA